MSVKEIDRITDDVIKKVKSYWHYGEAKGAINNEEFGLVLPVAAIGEKVDNLPFIEGSFLLDDEEEILLKEQLRKKGVDTTTTYNKGNFIICATLRKCGKRLETKKISNVINFMELLQKEFINARLSPVTGLLKPDEFYYDVELDISAEACYPLESKIIFLNFSKKEWNSGGYGSGGELYFQWDTSSNHRVVLEGSYCHDDMGREETDGSYILTIGDEHSSEFYPTVLELASKCGFIETVRPST